MTSCRVGCKQTVLLLLCATDRGWRIARAQATMQGDGGANERSIIGGNTRLKTSEFCVLDQLGFN